MPVIKPISDLRNYTEVTRDVSYGNRVYLTKNGHGDITMIDMHELDDIEKELALYKFKYEMAIAEKLCFIFADSSWFILLSRF